MKRLIEELKFKWERDPFDTLLNVTLYVFLASLGFVNIMFLAKVLR